MNFYLALYHYNTKKEMLKSYFLRITLFTILAFLSLLLFVITAISRQPEEIKNPVLYRTALATLLLVVSDVILKQVLKLKTGWLWLIEIFLMIATVYLWIIS